jgi:hypothetical protein
MTTMIQYILIIAALITVGNLSAQETRKPKRIIISLNDTVRFIKEYNKNDSLIFIKDIQFWKDKSEHLFIDGFLFENNRVVFEYHATEDFLRLIHYEYDTITGLKDQFVKHTKSKTVNNELLHSIGNRDELISLVESVIPKNSELTNILDSNEYHTLLKKGRSEIYTRYKNNFVTVKVTKKYDKRENLILVEEQNEWQTATTSFKYNKNNQVIKERFGFDDYKSKTNYFYDNNRLTKSKHKVRNGNVSSSDYFYENGFLIKEIVNRPEGIRIYTFEYEF